MPKVTLLLVAATLATAQPVAAFAAASVCRTVNGRTTCSQSGDALSCQTVNGKTLCLSGPGTLRCETVDGRTTCSSTREAPLQPVPAMPEDEPDFEPVMPDPGLWGRDPSIERDGHGLRVRTGTLDLRFGRFP